MQPPFMRLEIIIKQIKHLRSLVVSEHTSFTPVSKPAGTNLHTYAIAHTKLTENVT